MLDSGLARVAEKTDDGWQVNQWLKKAVLLSFRLNDMTPIAGGPGGSGISTARGSRFPLFMAMREFGDVIAFDQRGVGQSQGNLRCNQRYAVRLDEAGEQQPLPAKPLLPDPIGLSRRSARPQLPPSA